MFKKKISPYPISLLGKSNFFIKEILYKKPLYTIRIFTLLFSVESTFFKATSTHADGSLRGSRNRKRGKITMLADDDDTPLSDQGQSGDPMEERGASLSNVIPELPMLFGDNSSSDMDDDNDLASYDSRETDTLFGVLTSNGNVMDVDNHGSTRKCDTVGKELVKDAYSGIQVLRNDMLLKKSCLLLQGSF